MIRFNPDEDLRSLERFAAAGNVDAEQKLARARIRSGRSDPATEIGLAVVRRGPICGWEPSWDYPGALVLNPPDRGWGFWITATPFWDLHPGVPVSVAGKNGEAISLPSWELPRQDPIEDALVYRALAASLIANLAALLCARAVGSCSCSTFVEPSCPAHGDLERLLAGLRP